MMVVIVAAVFIVVTGIVLAAYYALSAESPTVQRLRRLVPEPATAAQRTGRTSGAGPGFVQQLLVGVGQYGIGRGDRSLAQRLSAAGLRGKNATLVFLGVRTLLSLPPALLVLSYRVSAGHPLAASLWVAALVWAVGHVVVNQWLGRRARRRIQQITEGLPDSLDLMVVCLESGLGLNATIARVGEERAALNDPLGDEFALVSLELRGGKTREDALRALGDRNGVEDLKALAGLIIQSDRLGASMGKTLRAHADLLRTKRRQRAEEAARKLPIKVLFPLAVFLLPPLFIMVAGPAFLRLSDLVKLITGAH
jgi:tight adherence protein C